MPGVQDLIYRLDLEVFRALHVGFRREWLDPLFRVVNDMGLGHAQLTALVLVGVRGKLPLWALLSLAAAFAVIVSFIEKDWTTGVALLVCLAVFWKLSERVAWGALAASAAAGLLRLVLVPIAGRSRPSNLELGTPLEPLYGASSFPSGHATTSFAIAFFALWAMSGSSRSWPALAVLAWALLIGIGRVYGGVHYPTDVVAAAALAGAVASAAWLLLQGWVSAGGTPEPQPADPPPP